MNSTMRRTHMIFALAVTAGTLIPATLCNAAPPPRPRPDATLLPPRTEGKTKLLLITHGYRDTVNHAEGEANTWAEDMRDHILASMTADERAKWDVRLYDWKDQALGVPRQTPAMAVGASQRLGGQLGLQLQSMGYTEVHTAAHSAGSYIADNALRRLPEGTKSHLTLWDAYIPGNRGNVSQLGQRATFAEQYFHSGDIHTNATLKHCYNMDITALDDRGTGPLELVEMHKWPYVAYDRTAQSPTPVKDPRNMAYSMGGFGFNKTLERGNLPSHTEQDGKYRRERLVKCTTTDDPQVAAATLPYDAQFGAPVQFATRVQSPTGTIVGLNDDQTSILLQTGSPVWLEQEVITSSPVNCISFDHSWISEQVSGAVGDGWLSIYVDRDNDGLFTDVDLIWQSDEQFDPTGVDTWVPLDIQLMEDGRNFLMPGSQRVALRIDPASSLTSSLVIENFRLGNMAIPSPGVAVLVVGAAVALRRRRVPSHGL